MNELVSIAIEDKVIAFYRSIPGTYGVGDTVLKAGADLSRQEYHFSEVDPADQVPGFKITMLQGQTIALHKQTGHIGIGKTTSRATINAVAPLSPLRLSCEYNDEHKNWTVDLNGQHQEQVDDLAKWVDDLLLNEPSVKLDIQEHKGAYTAKYPGCKVFGIGVSPQEAVDNLLEQERPVAKIGGALIGRLGPYVVVRYASQIGLGRTTNAAVNNLLAGTSDYQFSYEKQTWKVYDPVSQRSAKGESFYDALHALRSSEGKMDFLKENIRLTTLKLEGGKHLARLEGHYGLEASGIGDTEQDAIQQCQAIWNDRANFVGWLQREARKK